MRSPKEVNQAGERGHAAPCWSSREGGRRAPGKMIVRVLRTHEHRELRVTNRQSALV